jgi:hypothetical protein
LRALLLQVSYSVRSERMLMQQLDYSLLFRWFVGLNIDDPIWDVTVFTKNRQRLLAGDSADAFLQHGFPGLGVRFETLDLRAEEWDVHWLKPVTCDSCIPR